MIITRIVFMLVLAIVQVGQANTCSCSTESLERIMCTSNFAGLVQVKGVGPSNKHKDSFLVEWRQSFQMSSAALKAFTDFGTGLVWTQRKYNSCAIRLKSNTLYLIIGQLGGYGQPMVSFCTAIPYEMLSFYQKMQLNMIALRGLQCANVIT